MPKTKPDHRDLETAWQVRCLSCREQFCYLGRKRVKPYCERCKPRGAS